MDSRTRKRYLAQVMAMSHLLQRHYSALPAGKSYADILSDGIAAALALGLEEVRREAARLQAIPPLIITTYDALQSGVPPLPADCQPLHGDHWGIGRGVPVGDM